MDFYLLVAAGACACAAIYSDRGAARPPVFYLLKPLTTLLIIGVAISQDSTAPLYHQWVLVALGLSLLGDIALMFHGNRWFLTGLGSFLLAHLAFIAAFLSGVESPTLPWWAVLSPLAGALVLPRLWPGAKSLRPAVVAYGLVLCGMVLAAAARYQADPGATALLALAGAVLFQASDSLLGFRQFVAAYRGAQPLILATYWLAISLIALSA